MFFLSTIIAVISSPSVFPITGELTSILHSANCASSFSTVIIAIPFSIALTLPFSSTIATFSSEVFHTTLPVYASASSVSSMTLSFIVSPLISDFSLLSSFTGIAAFVLK